MNYLNTVGFILFVCVLGCDYALSKRSFIRFTPILPKYPYIASKTTTTTSKSLQVTLSIDESEVNELKLKLKWDVMGGSGNLNRFALTSATKSILGYSYNSAKFNSKEIKNPGTYISNRFIDYKTISENNENDCAKKCFYGDKYYRNFECNIYHFSETFDECTLFQYDRTKMVHNSYAYEIFADICMSPFEDYDDSHFIENNHCKEVIDYTDNAIFYIKPSTQYKFALEVRDSVTGWSGVVYKEYMFTPKLTFKVDGDLRVGQKVNITCEINLIPSLVDSISWTDKTSKDKRKAVLTIDSLSYAHHNKNYTCEAKYYLNTTGIFLNKPTLSKSFMLRLTDADNYTPVSTVEPNIVERDLTVHLTINYDATINRLIVLSSINNNQNYSLVKKYIPFTDTDFDNTRLYGAIGRKNVSDASECALECLINPLCNHYVYTTRSRSSFYYPTTNCMLSNDKSNQNRIFACLYNEICQNIVPYEEFFNNKTLSIKILPNTQYNFTLQIYNENFKWSKIETNSIKIPLTIDVKKKGSTTLERNAVNKFVLTCVTNVDKNTGKIKWFRDNEEIKTNDDSFNVTEDYTTHNNLANSYLNFNVDSKNVSFDGTYTCSFTTTNTNVGTETTFYSEVVDLEFAYKEKYFYNTTNQNFTFSSMTGAFAKIPCIVQGYPYPKMKWEKDGVEVKLSIDGSVLDKDVFVVPLNDARNHTLNYVLGLSLSKIMDFTKFRCILEPDTSSIVLREHTINIIDNSPKINVDIDKTSLDQLKVSFNLSVKGAYENSKFRKYDESPVKYRIRFSRRNEIITDDKYYDAPNILLKDNLTNITNSTTVFSMGTLVASNTIKSCKMACLYNPYCKYYDFYMLLRKCVLFVSDKWSISYRNLAEDLLKTNNNEASDLKVTLLLDNHLVLVSNISEHTDTLNEVTVESCEDVKIISFLKDTVCMGEIQEYKNPYVFDNLLPDTEYNFTVEGINPFGKIKSEIQTIYVPFPLNNITESEWNHNTNNYSLKCSTPLKKNDKLSFIWFRNDHELKTGEHYTIFTNEDSNFSSILRFNGANKNISGTYSCTLLYNSTEYTNAKTTYYHVLFEFGPNYEIKDSKVSLGLSDTRNESCIADGYPLPKLEWFFNNQSLNNSLQNVKIVEHSNYHFRVINELVIENATKENIGNYSCVMNGKTVIKTLNLDISESKNEGHKANVSSVPVWIGVGLLCTILLVVLIGTLILKREKIRSAFASLNLRRPHLLSYNRMEDEAQIMDSPVDTNE